jgi:hypothetical protein
MATAEAVQLPWPMRRRVRSRYRRRSCADKARPKSRVDREERYGDSRSCATSVAYATSRQISLSAPILVTTVVCLVIFVTAVFLSPETKGKELVAELQVA